MPPVIEKLEQLEANIKRFEAARKSNRQEIAKEYRNLLKRGTLFVPYITGEGLGFAPSRFVGYVGNDVKTHKDIEGKHGSRTTYAIDQILGFEHIEDAALEGAYQKLCATLGIKNPKPPFGNTRKFWRAYEAIAFIEDDLVDEILHKKPTNTSTQALVKARIGQGRFREDLLDYWGCECPLTGCQFAGILRASHIKPWRHSDNDERLDKFNGLLLAPNADALFDSGFITFEASGKIRLSSHISEEECENLGIGSDAKIPLHKRHQPYLKFHKKKIFKR